MPLVSEIVSNIRVSLVLRKHLQKIVGLRERLTTLEAASPGAICTER